MLKPSFPATAEGLPTRRQFLGSLVAGSAVGAVSAGALALAIPSQPSPDERINIAMTEINAALAEMYPGWEFQSENRVIRPQIYRPGGVDLGAPHRHSVLIYAYERRHGTEKARLFVDLDLDEVSA